MAIMLKIYQDITSGFGYNKKDNQGMTHSPEPSHLLNIFLLEQISYGVDFIDMPHLQLAPSGEEICSPSY